MAQHVLINKKTGKEVHASNPEAVLAKFPKTFKTKTKPQTVLAKDITVKESVLIDSKADKKTPLTDKESVKKD